MASATIPVDPFNPGQVFACLGFLEAADVLLGDAEGGFDWSEGPVRFHLSANGDANPVETVLRFLAEAEVKTLAPAGSGLSTASWAVPTAVLPEGASFPFPPPDSFATLPAVLSVGDQTVVLDYWGDVTVRDNVKFWAGAQGKPGAAIAKDAISLIGNFKTQVVENPFDFHAPQTGSFRFDWRRDYVPMEAGFSPNDHKNSMTMLGFPLVEILAAIGLSHARPLRREKLLYRYAIVAVNAGQLLPPMLLRAALGTTAIGVPSRSFEMRLDWPGQENQARCIVETKEITP